MAFSTSPMLSKPRGNWPREMVDALRVDLRRFFSAFGGAPLTAWKKGVEVKISDCRLIFLRCPLERRFSVDKGTSAGSKGISTREDEEAGAEACSLEFWGNGMAAMAAAAWAAIRSASASLRCFKARAVSSAEGDACRAESWLEREGADEARTGASFFSGAAAAAAGVEEGGGVTIAESEGDFEGSSGLDLVISLVALEDERGLECFWLCFDLEAGSFGEDEDSDAGREVGAEAERGGFDTDSVIK